MASGFRLTKEEFSTRASEIHKGRYDYRLVNYVNAKTKVEIICPVHGAFEQTPTGHLAGKGCKACQGVKTGDRCRGSAEKFIARSKLAHGDRYDYSNVCYVNGHAKVDIMCHEHGMFSQKPNHHAVGIGCPSCGKQAAADKMKRSTEEFIARAQAVHGEKYDYSQSEYKNNFKKLAVVCPAHGEWTTSPANHFTGSGCPACGMRGTGYDTNKIGTLYVLTYDNITKVGVTNRPIKKRLREVCSDSQRSFKVLKEYNNLEGGFCYDLETSLLQLLKAKYKQPDFSFCGSTECFYNVNNAELLNTIEERLASVYVEQTSI